MSLSFDKKILIDCSQSKSESSKLGGWTNKLPETISNVSTIQVYSAYINKRGSDQSSIEIVEGDDLNKINTQETNITTSYYKCATGQSTIPMPYNFFISSLQKNMIIARDVIEAQFFQTNPYPLAPASVTNEYSGYQQDQGQTFFPATQIHSKYFPINASFAYCSNLHIDDENVTRLGALPTGNLEDQSNYFPYVTTNSSTKFKYNNVFKTYLGDACQPLDGSRCKAFQFSTNFNKYLLVTKKSKIDIIPGSYTPSNLGEIITDQLDNTQNDNTNLNSKTIHTNLEELRNIQDEREDKVGFYIETPCTDKNLGLYISRSKLNGIQNIVAHVNSNYPLPSPIVRYTTHTTGSSTTTDGRLFEFNPLQDSYYECGKSDLSFATNYDSGIKAYNWSMISNSQISPLLPGQFFKPNVYFRYPETLIAGQDLVTGRGLGFGEDVIDFNPDLKLRVAGASELPNLPRQSGKNQLGEGYLLNKGDYDGYLILDLEWNRENLLKVKAFFDKQMEENCIENIYVYDWTDTNPTSRNQTIRGKRDGYRVSGDHLINTGNRWIHIANNNGLDITSDTGTVNVGRGTTDALKEKTGTTNIYDGTNFPLLNYGSDFLGDNNDMTSTNDISTNNQFTFRTTLAGGNLGMGNPYLNNNTVADATTGKALPELSAYNYAHPNRVDNNTTYDRRLNGSFDVDCINTKYMAHQQLISVRTKWTDKNGESRVFEFPTDESQEMEDRGFGYAYKYDGLNNSPNNTAGKSYIMFYVGKKDGGLQRNVISYYDPLSSSHVYTQALGWVPFFSSGGCNQAIMDVIGQGAKLNKDSFVDNDFSTGGNGDIDVGSFGTSIMEAGGGAISPQISYSDQNSRFNITNLYSPITTSNYYQFSNQTGEYQSPNISKEIISYNRNNQFYYLIDSKIKTNPLSDIDQSYTFKILNAFNEIMPYNFTYKPQSSTVDISQGLSFYYSEGGMYIEKWIEKVDAFGNVIIEENEENFSKSLWGLLGYTYKQTHNTFFETDRTGIDITVFFGDIPLLKQYRNGATINEDGAVGNQLYYSIPITNNSNVFTTDFNNLMYVNRNNFNMFLNQGSNNINTLEILSQSTNFLAENLPIRSEDPFFIIESDILSQSGLQLNYYSQDSLLPAVDIVEKSINTSDFYSYNGNLIHQIYRENYQINNVSHIIRRSNGKVLNTNQFSSIIYLANVKVIVGYSPQQLELYEEQKEEQEKEYLDREKLLNKLKNPKTQKEKLLENLLELNELEKQRFNIEPYTEELSNLNNISLEQQLEIDELNNE